MSKKRNETGNAALIVLVVVVVAIGLFLFLKSGREHELAQQPQGGNSEQKQPAQEVVTPKQESAPQHVEPAKEEQVAAEVDQDAEPVVDVFEDVPPSTTVDISNLEQSTETFENSEPVHQPLSTPLPKSEAVERRPDAEGAVPEDFKPQVAPKDGYSSREQPVAFASTIEDGRAGTGAGGTPPDTHGAVGPNHILTVSNGNFSITPRAAGSTPTTIAKGTFFNSLASDLFDPKAVFDQQTDRYYVTMAVERRSGSSGIVFAVSTTDDPTGTWRVWKLDYDDANTYWADYPTLGYSSDKITISLNSFAIADDAFGGIKIFTIDKASAVGTGNISYGRMTVTNAGGTVVPAETVDNTAATQHMIRVGTSNLFGSGRLQLYYLTGSATLPTFTPAASASLADAWSISIPNAKQLGSTALIETNDDRIMNAVYRNGKIWAAHTVAMSTAVRDRAAVKWWEINVSDASVVQSGLIMDTVTADNATTIPNPTAMHYYYPSVSVNKDGDALVGFSGSSGGSYVGTYYAMRRASDPVGYMDPPVLAKAGTGAVSTSRWGDYSATMVDPVDDTKFWTVQQYAVSGGYGLWWTQISTQSDTIAPTVQSATAPTSTTVRVTFNESMLNNTALRTASNYTFSGGGAALTASAVTVVSGTVVDLTVNQMTKNSSYTVTVSTNVSDLSGNALSSGARTASFTGAATAVTATLATTVSASVTKVTPLPFTATFSAAVTGFVAADLTLTNATVSNFSGSGASYSFNLVPSGQGTVAVSIPANAASDGFGNNNGAGAQISKTFDSVKPVATFATTATEPTATSPIPFTVTFQEDVTGFVVSDLSVVNGTASNFQTVSPQSYSFSVTPAAGGAVSVSLPAGRVSDTAGNTNNLSATLSRTYETITGGGGQLPAFSTTLSCAAGTYTTTAAFSCNVVFGSSVSNFIASDITVTNGSVSGLTPASGTSYSFLVTAAAQGTVTVRVGAGVASDATTATNAASSTISKTYDSVRPSAAFTSSTSNPTNSATIAVQVTLSESVATFNASKLVLLNATLSGFSGSGVNYSFTLTPLGQGEVRVEIPVGAIADLAGNTNSTNPKLSRTYDSIAPPAPSITVSN